MITIILTYRNRKISILKKCLNSLMHQSQKSFEVVLVNYGSNDTYAKSLEELVKDYSFLKLVNCKTQGQLWCKSKAINIALKNCESSHMLIGDVDMMYHPDFIKIASGFKNKDDATYFQVSFLSKEESELNKEFSDYVISFKSSEGATGMTLYNTDVLKSINGFDEFYNGWGSEDTDVHVRLKNAGYKVNFYDDNVLMLHQWHAKQYRTSDSLEPFHSNLEQINQEYLTLTETTKKTKANLKFDWGIYNASDYVLLENKTNHFKITNTTAEVKGFINSVLLSEEDKIISLEIAIHKEYKSLKQFVKKLLGKKVISFLSMQETNNTLLEAIINNLRNCPYNYQYNQKLGSISLIIKL